MNKSKSEVFIFRYDPHSSFEGMFEEFWDAVDGKIEAVEPHIVRSNSIEALSSNLTKNRLQLFATLVEKKPVNLTELAHLLQKDYALVRRDARILEGMGLIKLEKVANQAQNGHGSGIRFNEVRPIALYKRIVFDFPIQEEVTEKEKQRSKSWNLLDYDEQQRLIRYWGYEKARIENGYIEETERLERQSQEYLKEIELAKFHEERGKINCECYSCEEQKIIRSEVINEQKKIITDYEAEQKKEMAVEWIKGECNNCYEYKKVDSENGLCKSCAKKYE